MLYPPVAIAIKYAYIKKPSMGFRFLPSSLRGAQSRSQLRTEWSHARRRRAPLLTLGLERRSTGSTARRQDVTGCVRSMQFGSADTWVPVSRGSCPAKTVVPGSAAISRSVW